MRLNINHNSFLGSQSQMDIFLLFKWDPVSNQDTIMHNEKMLQDSNFSNCFFFLTGNKKERKMEGLGLWLGD